MFGPYRVVIRPSLKLTKKLPTFLFIIWDPKNARSFLVSWFLVKAWWWPTSVKTFCHCNYNKPVVFDGDCIILLVPGDTSGWLLSKKKNNTRDISWGIKAAGA